MRVQLPLMKNLLAPLAKNVLLPLGVTAAASTKDAANQKKIYGSHMIADKGVIQAGEGSLRAGQDFYCDFILY